MRLVFLVSGAGGTLRFVRSYVRELSYSVKVVGVLADRQCQALEQASSWGCDAGIIDFGEPAQTSLIRRLETIEPDLIITTVHKVLKPEVLRVFGDRMVNVHYSILPAFGGTIGMRSLTQAIDYGARWIGATCHEVTEELDGGRPISQVVFRSAPAIESQLEQEFMFRAGCLSLLAALKEKRQFQSGRVRAQQPVWLVEYEVLTLHLDPVIQMSGEEQQLLSSEAFWQLIKW